jgi:hypothetical protein
VEVLTPETLARFFGVRAHVGADPAGRPVVMPLEALGPGEEELP